jgi:PKD repeat protein
VTATDPPPNQPPTAGFSSTVDDLTVNFDATASEDLDGTILTYDWDFGDGNTGSGLLAQNTYAVAGPYTVTLTVTDDDGDSDTETATVTATDPPPNQPPTAAFTSTVDDLTVTFDATDSEDLDGTIVTYDWDFGDGLSGAGITTPHTYAEAGDYTVTLTVTDDDGDFDTETTVVTALAPPPEIAADTFERTVVNGLGTTDPGGSWTLQGPATSFAVNGGVGRITGNAGSTRAGYLTTATAPAVDLVTDVSLDRAITGNGAFVSVVGRRISEGNDYRLKLQYRSNGTVGVFLERYVGGVQTQMTFVANVPGLTVAPNDVLRVRLQVDGTSSTLVRGKVWRVSEAEPAAWLVSTTDATPAVLQAPGHIGVHFYTSGSWTGAGAVLSIDNLVALPPE